MLRLLRRKNRRSPQAPFSKTFYQSPHHQWIKRNPKVKRVFDILIECLQMEPTIDQSLSTMGEIIFLPASGKLACTLQGQDSSKFIVVFPDLLQIIHSASPMRGVAILAHELGHIYCQHGENPKNLSTLECQIEADAFALTLGLGKELQEVLLDNGLDIDSRVRISQLTASILCEQN